MATRTTKTTAATTVRNIRQNSRKSYSGEEKIRIVLEGQRGEQSVADAGRCGNWGSQRDRLALGLDR
jgi:transposase-like protein